MDIFRRLSPTEYNLKTSTSFASSTFSSNAFNQKGRYFGYPQCCIDQFITNFEKRVRIGAANKNAANGHGFIPCNVHSLQIINKQIKIEDLIHNRVCEKAFPNDNGSSIVEQRLKRRFRMVMMEIRRQ